MRTRPPTSIAGSVPQTSTRWSTVALVCIAGIVAAFQIGKAPVALPELSAELGLSRVGGAWVISMFNVLGAICGAPIGALVDRVGLRRAMLGGLIVLALASLAGAAATGATTLLATRFFEGFGFIFAVIAAPGLIVRSTSAADQRLAFGLWSCYLPMGSALMMAASPLLIAATGWRGLWLANAGLLLVVAVAAGLATRNIPSTALSQGRGAGAVLADLLRTVRSPGPLTLALTFGLYTLQYLTIVGFLPTLLIQNDGMGVRAAGSLTAFAAFVNALGNLAAGWLLYRGTPRWRLVALPSLVMVVAILLIFAAPLPFALRYGAVLVFALVSGALPAALLSGAPMHAPTPGLVGTTLGIINQGSNLGQTVGPPAVAKLADMTGTWAWSPAILVSCTMIGIGLSLVLRRLEARHRKV